jgi:hypothetical protein
VLSVFDASPELQESTILPVGEEHLAFCKEVELCEFVVVDLSSSPVPKRSKPKNAKTLLLSERTNELNMRAVAKV